MTAGILANSSRVQMTDGAPSGAVTGYLTAERVTLTVTPAASVFTWVLTPPVGSRAALSGDHDSAPWFRPDVEGTYTVTVLLPGPVNYALQIGVADGRALVTSTGIELMPRVLTDTPNPRTGHLSLVLDSASGRVKTRDSNGVTGDLATPLTTRDRLANALPQRDTIQDLAYTYDDPVNGRTVRDPGHVDVRVYLRAAGITTAALAASTDCSAAVANADAAAIAAGVPLRIVWTIQIAQNVVLSSEVEFTPGSMFTRGGTAVLRHSGKVHPSGLSQCWDCSAGQWIRLDEGVVGSLRPEWFGARGDVAYVPAIYGAAYVAADLPAFTAGSVSGTDDASAFMTMREATRSWNVVHIELAQRIYGVSHPHWACGWPGAVMIDGHGASIVNLTGYTGPLNGQQFADLHAFSYNIPGPFSTWDFTRTTVAGTDAFVRGWKIQSASAGGRSVQLSLNAWVTTTSYLKSDHVTNAGNVYEAAGNGTSGASAPVHTSGTVSDGGVSWKFLGAANNAATYPFAAGTRVLVEGFGQQFGSNPPCSRYFEYPTVTAFDAPTLTLSLDADLKYTYDSRWWDYQDTISGGAPRVESLDNPNFTYTESFTLRNLNLLHNPTYDGRGTGGGVVDLINGAIYVAGCRHATIEHVTSGYFASTIVESYEIRKSRLGYHEIDKLIHRGSVEDSDLEYASQATGVNYLTLRRCRVNGVPQLVPHNLILEDCEFHNTNRGETNAPTDVLKLGSFGFYMRSARVRNCRIGTESGPSHTIDNSSNAHGLVLAGANGTFTVDSAPSNTKVLVSVAGDSDVYVLQRGLAVGSLVHDTQSTVTGRVTNIYRADASHLAIEATFSATPTAGHVFTFEAMQELEIDGIEQVSGTTLKDISQHFTPRARHRTNAAVERLVLGMDDFLLTPSGGNEISEYLINAYHGRLRRIWCEAAKVHSGAAPASISVPNAMASWQYSGATFSVVPQAGPDGNTNSGIKFTCNAGNAIHTAFSLITNPHQWTCRLVVWLKNDAAFPWRCIQLGDAFPASGALRYINLNTGALGTSTTPLAGGAPIGLATATKLGDAVTLGVGADAAWQKWQFDGTQLGTIAPHAYIGAAADDGLATFNAIGTETVLIGTGGIYGPVLSDLNLVAQLSLFDPVAGAYLQSIDLTRTGVRECLDSGATGGGGADILSATSNTKYQQLSARLHTGGQMIIYADYTELPQFALEIETVRYR